MDNRKKNLAEIAIPECITDIAEFQKFKDILTPLQDGESYFLCASARNKYLSSTERELLGFNADKMFNQTLVTDLGNLEYSVNKCLTSFSLPSKRNLVIPRTACVVYFCINPRSLLKGFIQFQTKILESFALQSLTPNPQYTYLNKIVNNLYSAIQRSKSRGIWIDIDIDVDKQKSDIAYLLVLCLKKNNVENYTIETKSGYHILIKRSSLKGSSFKLQEELEKLKTEGYLYFNSGRYHMTDNGKRLLLGADEAGSF